jgi:hypothetical protein
MRLSSIGVQIEESFRGSHGKAIDIDLILGRDAPEERGDRGFASSFD